MSSARLNGKVNPNSVQTSAWFHWGLTTAYGNTTPAQNAGSGINLIPFFQDLTGLSSGITYHFRAVAENGNAIVFGNDEFFTTPGGGGQTVTIIATTPEAYEIGEVPGAFTIFRTGDTTNPVTVNFTKGGTAVEGVDYDPIGTSVSMGANVTNAQVVITPINNFIVGPDLTVILTLTAGIDYTIGSPNNATVTIHQTEANAPCSIFTADNTSFGPQSLPVSPGSVSWTTPIGEAGIGSFQFVHLEHAFKNYCQACAPPFEANTAIAFAVNQNGAPQSPYFKDGVNQGNMPQNTSASFEQPSCPGEFTSGFETEALAVADYATKTQPSFSLLDGLSHIIRIDSNKSSCDGNPPTPLFDFVRKLKLTVSQPITLQINNFSSYADGRFVVTYNAVVSGPIAFDASAATVQTALNLMSSIIADGGVTCAGALSTGMTVTWNVNGARNMLAPKTNTISPGIRGVSVETQTGTGAQPEIQTVTVGSFCVDFNINTILPEYTGVISNRDLNLQTWYENSIPFDPDNPAERQSNFEFLDSRVRLISGPAAPVGAPTVTLGGAGVVDAGTHSWKISFVEISGESGGGPASADLVIPGGGAAVNLTNIPLGPVGTSARNIYRTLAGGSIYYLVDTLFGNTVTSFVDNISDADIFNSGFGSQVRPASCFWTCEIVCVANVGVNIASTIWFGTKLTGFTPEGTYDLSFPWDGAGLIDCPMANQEQGGLTSLSISGTF